MNALPRDTTASEKVKNADFELRIARDKHAFLALEQQWTALERVATARAFFQSFEWCRKAIEHKRMDGDPNLFVCCVFASDALVGLLPLAYWKKGRRTVLTGLAEPFQLYTEMLTAPGHSPVALYRVMHDEILRSGADYLHLGQVRRLGPLCRAIQGLVPATGKPEAEPLADRPEWRTCEDVSRALEGLPEERTHDCSAGSSEAVGDRDFTPVACGTWATSARPGSTNDGQMVQDHVLALSPLGRLYCGVWLGYVQPLARQCRRAVSKPAW